MSTATDLHTQLSASQLDIYLDQAIHKNIPLYNIGGYVDLRGQLDPERLLQAHQLLTDNADVFRARFRHTEAQDDTQATTDSLQTASAQAVEFSGVQMLLGEPLPRVHIHDVSEHTQPDVAAREFIDGLYATNFALDGAMFVTGFIRLNANRYWYYGIAHHLVLDGWGFSNWVKSMADIYNALTRGEAPNLAFPSFVDFVKKENEYASGQRIAKDREFWQQRFQTLPNFSLPKLATTSDSAKENTRLAHQKSGRVTTTLDYARFAKHSEFATTLGASAAQLYIGALYVYFSRVHQQADITFSLPTHNRRTAAAKQTIGTALSVYPSRIRCDANNSVAALISTIAKCQRQEFRHQRYPLGQLHTDLGLRQQGRHRLFDISFNYQKLDYQVEIPEVDTSTHYLSNGYEQIPLTFTICDYGSHQAVELQIDYNLAYCDASKAEDLLARWLQLVEAMCADAQANITQLPLIVDTEQARLAAINQTAMPLPTSHVMHSFEGHVAAQPMQTALWFEDRSTSYQALNQYANQYAHALAAKGVRVGDHVGVCLPRSRELVICLLAVIKLRAVYVPMDPEFPAERLQLMLQHSGLHTLLATDSVASKLANDSANNATSQPAYQTLLLPHLSAHAATQSTENLQCDYRADDVAYVLFTSGSTGVPKGVVIQHGALANFLHSMAKTPGFTAADRLLAVTTVSFDIAGLELYLPLLTGGSLVLASAAMARDGQQLLDAIHQYRVTAMQATPATWQLLLAAGWQQTSATNAGLRIFCGGEALPSRLAEQLLPRAAVNSTDGKTRELWNLYGPTETTIWSTVQQVTDAHNVNIGRPIANTQLFLLDEQLSPVPYGEMGRLFIGGAGLAQGYLNNPEQSAQRFIANPHDEQGGLIYDTGDLASFDSGGNLHYHGRADNQIKLRGFRIELGDIEAALNRLDGVEDGCVRVLKGSDYQLASDFIAAYVVGESTLDTNSIKPQLTHVLPHYMLPLVVTQLAEFPLTPNGKKDRNALPAVTLAGHATDPQTITLPSNAIEQHIVAVWRDILNIDAIGVEQNLFELGATSLEVVRASKRIEARLKQPLSAVNLFEYTTIRALAQFLANEQQDSIEDRSAAISAGKRRMMQRKARRRNENSLS